MLFRSRDSQNAGALELLSKPLAEGTLLRRLAHHLKLPAPAAPPMNRAEQLALEAVNLPEGVLGEDFGEGHAAPAQG